MSDTSQSHHCQHPNFQPQQYMHWIPASNSTTDNDHDASLPSDSAKEPDAGHASHSAKEPDAGHASHSVPAHYDFAGTMEGISSRLKYETSGIYYSVMVCLCFNYATPDHVDRRLRRANIFAVHNLVQETEQEQQNLLRTHKLLMSRILLNKEERMGRAMERRFAIFVEACIRICYTAEDEALFLQYRNQFRNAFQGRQAECDENLIIGPETGLTVAKEDVDKYCKQPNPVIWRNRQEGHCIWCPER